MASKATIDGRALYAMLVKFSDGAISPSDIEVNFRRGTHPEDKDWATALFAIPSQKVAVTIPGDDTKTLAEEGWLISSVNPADIESFSRVYSALDAMIFELTRRKTMEGLKNATSQNEQWLIDALLRRRIPNPRRDLVIKGDDGKHLTTPDLAWEDIKLAVFIHGGYWHLNKMPKDQLKRLRDDKTAEKIAEDTETEQYAKDLRIANEMQNNGWMVLSYTAEELADAEKLNKTADEIQKQYKQRSRSKAERDKMLSYFAQQSEESPDTDTDTDSNNEASDETEKGGPGVPSLSDFDSLF